MPKFVKRPIVVEAVQFIFTPERCKDLADFLPDGIAPIESNTGRHLLIPTPEGEMRADEGDWIIKGVSGEFYPCKPDIFEKTYESAAGGVWLTVEIDGQRSGLRFEHPEDADDHIFMLYLGSALTALYRHEYERRFCCPCGSGLFRERFNTDPSEMSQDTLQAIKDVEIAAQRFFTLISDKIERERNQKCFESQ